MIAHIACSGRWPLVLVVLLLSTAANAQNGTIPTFSVTVTEPSELVEDVGTTRRLTRADLEQRNVRTLDEALRLVPGLYIRTGGDGTPRIDVRGFRSRHILLLVNGVQVNSTADGQFDPARISTAAIRDIKISYGSSSVLYGDNALAAVIEITTVDAIPDAAVELNAGTPDQMGAGGRYAESAGNWTFAAAATAYDTDAYRLPGAFVSTSEEDGGRRVNSDRARRDIRASIGRRFADRLAIASEWSVAAGSYGIPGSVVNDSADIFAMAPRYERVEDYRAVSGQFSATITPVSRFNLRAWVYRNAQREDRARYDDATFSSMDDPLVQGTFDSRERTTVTGTSALARLDLQRFGWLRLAANQRRESFDSDGIIRDVPVGGGGNGGGGGGGGRGGGAGRPATFDTRTFALDHHVDVYSGGAEWEVRPVSQLGVVLGTAFNVQRRPGGSTEQEPTWLTGVAYDATTSIRLHASAARKIRVPSIDQLFNASSGNPSLRAERAYGFDGGARIRVDRESTVGVSVFTTSARDFIERDSGSPFENHDWYRFRGVEVTAETTRVPSLALRAAYSFLDADDVTVAGAPQPLQTRPRHRTTADGVWTPRAGSAVRGVVYWTGSQLFDSRGATTVQRRVDGYVTVDAGFTQTLGGRYDLAVDVTNLFDELYEQSYGFPREGRAAVVTLRARLR